MFVGIWEIGSSGRDLTRAVPGPKWGPSWFGEIIDIQIITLKLKTPWETVASIIAIAERLVPHSFDEPIAVKIDKPIAVKIASMNL